MVIPCLNEGETIRTCVVQAFQTLQSLGVQGEVIVADNGSSDGSDTIAGSAGARVVAVKTVGYGCASRAGMESALGRYVITGDADGSHDFRELGRFLEKLRSGCDLVVGNRFLGGIQPTAMPWLHRYVGTPALSRLGRLLCGTRVADLNCGFRGIRASKIPRLQLQADGMEFASELVVKATQADLKVCEVPATMLKAGRSRAPHLNSFRDGWRHFRCLLAHRTRFRSARARAAMAAAPNKNRRG